MKALSARSVAELQSIFDEFDIELPDVEEGKSPTKKEMLLALDLAGVNNKTLKTWGAKAEATDEITPAEDIDTGDVVVFMNRNNPVFTWREYKFSSTKRFLPMPKDVALELVQAYEGFRIASREDIKRYYR